MIEMKMCTTYNIFSKLNSTNKKAVNIKNNNYEIFYSINGLFQIDDFGIAVKFNPNFYLNEKWKIVNI